LAAGNPYRLLLEEVTVRRPIFAILVGVVCIVAIIVCRRHFAPNAVEPEQQALTATSARQALLEMLSGPDAPNFDTRTGEIEAVQAGDNLLVTEKER
jgi:hypothetical protein